MTDSVPASSTATKPSLGSQAGGWASDILKVWYSRTLAPLFALACSDLLRNALLVIIFGTLLAIAGALIEGLSLLRSLNQHNIWERSLIESSLRSQQAVTPAELEAQQTRPVPQATPAAELISDEKDGEGQP